MSPDPDDLDTPMLEVPEERGRPEPEIVDPMVLVDGMVPIYNPLSFAFDLPYNGRVFRVRAHGVDLVSGHVAEMAVGPDNLGGQSSRFGLRRLYGPEARFEAAAKNRGLSLEALAAKMNEKVKRDADAIAVEAEKAIAASARELGEEMEADQGR